jgi:hypothetical protein
MRVIKGLALVVVTVAFLLTPAGAKADPVTYTTAGCFGSGCIAAPLATTGALTFTGVSASVSAPTFATLGHFRLAAGSGTLDGTLFTFQVMQSIPSIGQEFLSAMLTGSFTTIQSQAFAVFDQATFTLGNVTYTLLNGGMVALPAPSSGGGADVFANITVAATPEPPALALLGVGLIGLALVTKRQRFSTS